MDLKTFGEDDFEPRNWINTAWNTSGNQEKEVFVSNSVTRLQLYMKQLTNLLDETSTQIMTSIPRVLQDASSIQVDGNVLQQKLLSLEQKVQNVEEETGHSIQSLQKIDHLKSKLENAASTLREADKWAALALVIEDVLEAGVPTEKEKLMELSEQVSAMTASLEVLYEAPDYEKKRLQLEKLYNRLEAAITPPIIEALSQIDADRTCMYVSVFSGMSREAAACRAWRRAAATRMAASWGRLDSHSTDSLTRLLVDEAQKQLEWLTKVLRTDKPLAEMIRLYTDLLLSIEPSPTKVVSASLKMCSAPEDGIVMLMDLKRDIDEFVSYIKNIIDSPKQNKELIEPSLLKDFGRAAYAPLRESLPKYTELQSQVFLAYLNDPQLKTEDLMEYSRALLSLSERCEGWLDSARTKAKKIAGNASWPCYVDAVETLISTLTSQISSHHRRIEAAFLASVNSGGVTGVLSISFPSALTLETATAVLLDVMAKQVEQSEGSSNHPLLDLSILLSDNEKKKKPSLQGATNALRCCNEQLKRLARNILKSPIVNQLDKLSQLPVWNNNDALSTDLPDFALSPQEYITEIGQYLMTLPQHLEMHLSEKQAPWQFLTDVCTQTCDVYAKKILSIRNMDALGTKRCITDIVYLSNVVEDLGTSITPALRSLEKSLRDASPSQRDS